MVHIVCTFSLGQDTRDVVYDDGNGHVLLATRGTWILNEKDELMCGSVPMTSITATHGPDGPVFNPFLKYCGSIGEPRVHDVNKKMRNRCYSDSQVVYIMHEYFYKTAKYKSLLFAD